MKSQTWINLVKENIYKWEKQNAKTKKQTANITNKYCINHANIINNNNK